MGKNSFSRQSVLWVVGVGFFLIWVGLDSEAYARAGRSRTSGSRTYSSGGTTQKSTPAAPTAPSQQGTFQHQAQQPHSPQAAPPPTAGRGFFSGLAGGMMGGLLGGMIFRNLGLGGFDWGEGFGLADILFILILLGIIFFVVKLLRSRGAMQMSAAGAGSAGFSIPVSGPKIALPSTPQETFENASSLPALQQIKAMDPLFSQQGFLGMARNIFTKIQEGWSRRDLNMISPLLSPQMLEVFQEQLDQLKASGQVNQVEKITVRSAEFADAGQDHGEEFITVKFSAEAVDYLADKNGGQVLAGSTANPVEFAEYWTFSRDVGEKRWRLSGITQEKDYQ